MQGKVRRTEAEIAQQAIAALVCELNRKRLVGTLVAIAFVVLAAAALLIGLPMIAFCSLLIASLGLIRCADATWHLQDVHRRPTKFLHAPISVLEPNAATEPIPNAPT